MTKTPEQAVIITVLMPNAMFHDSVIYDLENTISKILPEKAYVQGREIGVKEGTIYVNGPSADTIWATVAPVIRRTGLHRKNTVRAILRYGNNTEKPLTLS